MKNRYGADGMTYGAKVNTNNGNIEINKDEMDEDDLTFDNGQSGPPRTQLQNKSTFSPDEKNYLNQKFVELVGKS